MKENEQGGTVATLAEAEALERAGKVVEAATTYQAMLRQTPDDPEALFRLGKTMGHLGELELGLALLGQAAARAPDVAGYQRWLGELLLAGGHLDDATESFRAAMLLEPGDPDARLGLAEALLDRGLPEEALAALGGHAPEGVRTERVLGRLALAGGQPDRAADLLVAHLRRVPTDATGYFFLGVALQIQDLFEPAAASYRQAVALDPNLYEALTNLSTVLLAMGDVTAAVEHADQAVALAPDRAGLRLNRANAQRDAGDIEAAAEDYRAAVTMAPDFAEAWSSLANLSHDLREWAVALDAHDRAVALEPDIPQMRWNRSFTRLATGDLTGGWEDYEARLQTKAARPEPRDFPWPAWRGEELASKRLLVWREQGLGDELLFATCVPELVAVGAEVTLLASPRLSSLFRRSLDGVRVREDGEDLPADQHFDYQIPVGSLPRWLRNDRKAFRPSAPLVVADAVQIGKWQNRLATLGDRPKIGVCWRSGLVNSERQRHYAALEAWLPLLQVPGIAWVNLQYDDCEEELSRLERDHGVVVARWPAEDLRDDLESVAGLLTALDGIVTAPTAVSSLAGATGRPTWQVDAGGDWTALGEDRSPWFPTIQIASCGVGGDWAPVMTRVGSEVAVVPRSGG